MQYFTNSNGAFIIGDVIVAVKSARDYLSSIDGKIGDGDHGVNMYKGFSMAESLITDNQSFTDAIRTLGQVLLLEIGGSMGPLYGTFFRSIYRILKEKEYIYAADFLDSLESALNSVKETGHAQVGDKTMIDTLEPAVNEFKLACMADLSFKDSIISFTKAAKTGMESTKEMVAKVGRSSRLGERSAGVLDPGAVSCYIILETMGISIMKNLQEK